MHGRGVQRIRRAPDAQKPGALLERLGPHALDQLQVLARAELAVLVAPGHDFARERRAHAGDARQQHRRGGIELHPHRVYAAYHHFVEFAAEELGVHIVLVLPHANRLGIELDEFGQRILQPAAD